MRNMIFEKPIVTPQLALIIQVIITVIGTGAIINFSTLVFATAGGTEQQFTATTSRN